MEEKTSPVSDEIKRLRACINDLVSVQALASVWGDQEPHQIVDSLIEVLVLMLRLDFAYARVGESIEGSCIELLRLPDHPGTEPREIIQAIASWLKEGRVASRRSMPNPVGDGELYLAQLGLGLRDEIGIIVAGSRRADFPAEAETLLLRVAANQAAGFKNKRRAFPPADRGRQGLRHFHAGLRRAGDDLEQGCRADQGLSRGGDPGEAFVGVLPAGRYSGGQTRASAEDSGGRGAIRRRRLALAQRRISVLG